MSAKTIQKALREWMDESPNKTPRNTLVIIQLERKGVEISY